MLSLFGYGQQANGLRYLRVGGRGLCLGAGKSPKPEKCLKTAQNPTSRLHALLGGFSERQTRCLKTRTTTYLTIFYAEL